MYESVKEKVIAKYGSINKLSMAIGVTNVDLYCAFNGKKPMYPKYKLLIAAALGENAVTLFAEEESK